MVRGCILGARSIWLNPDLIEGKTLLEGWQEGPPFALNCHVIVWRAFTPGRCVGHTSHENGASGRVRAREGARQKSLDQLGYSKSDHYLGSVAEKISAAEQRQASDFPQALMIDAFWPCTARDR